MIELSPEEKREEWLKAKIAWWYLRPDQRDLYTHVVKSKNPFIECARRYGKTTTILCYVLEQLIRNPGYICRWCEPDKNQAREVVLDEVEKIQSNAPAWARFKWVVTDSHFLHPNGSKLYLRGVNHDRGDSARGATAHIIVADEFGTWRDPDYIVQEALRPQLQTTNGPFIFASTPPKDLGHAYYEHKEWAIRDGRFIQRVIHDNKSLSEERIEELKKECGGEHTPAWRREYLCEPVSDPDALVIPEFSDALHVVEDDYPRPSFFDPYVGVDLGFNDSTAFLFGYWDFINRELVIEDELVVSGKNSRELTDAAKQKELALWGALKPYLRIGDNDRQQLHDMLTMCGYSILPTRKDDKLAAINALRLRFTQGKVKIKRRCKVLSYQLKVGLWNERRTDFLRGEKTGHLDAIDALIYLHRNVNESHNPYPHNAGVSIHTHAVPIEPGQITDSGALKQVFRPLSSGRGR